MKLPLLDADSHVVVQSSVGNLILDSGSPISFAAERPGTFVEELGTRIEGMIAPFRLEELSRLIGLRIEALVGMDLLGRMILQIDWRGQPYATVKVTGDAEAAIGSAAIPLGHVSSVPTVNFSFADTDEDASAILDSGAAVSLAPRAWLREHGEPTGTLRREWFPAETGLVEFDSPLYRVRIARRTGTGTRIRRDSGAASGRAGRTDGQSLSARGIDAFRQGVAAATLDSARSRLQLLRANTEEVANRDFNARRVTVAPSDTA